MAMESYFWPSSFYACLHPLTCSCQLYGVRLWVGDGLSEPTTPPTHGAALRGDLGVEIISTVVKDVHCNKFTSRCLLLFLQVNIP